MKCPGTKGTMVYAYNTSSVRHTPRQLAVGTDDRASEDNGDELNLGIFWMVSALIDGTIGIVGERLCVSDQHFRLGDQMDGLMWCEDLDCENELVSTFSRLWCTMEGIFTKPSVDLLGDCSLTLLIITSSLNLEVIGSVLHQVVDAGPDRLVIPDVDTDKIAATFDGSVAKSSGSG